MLADGGAGGGTVFARQITDRQLEMSKTTRQLPRGYVRLVAELFFLHNYILNLTFQTDSIGVNRWWWYEYQIFCHHITKYSINEFSIQ
jgi:hypothetical protein